MSDLETLRDAAERAEAAAQEIMADRDAALRDVRDRYDQSLQDANQEAAEAQKALCDAEAAAALVGRDDAQDVADKLGLTLPE